MNNYLLLIILSLSFNCTSKKESPKTEIKSNIITSITNNDTIISLNQTKINIRYPKTKFKGDLLILPGWNFPYDSICAVSDFCTMALDSGFRLILPDMKKSVYASHYYSETKSSYKTYKTSTWVVDTMIPFLQKELNIFTTKYNYIHGISTGARGAAIIHLKTDTLFKKVILLSGDYDQTKMPTDNLMKNTYGSYEMNTDRWIKDDNVITQIDKWKAAVLIAHSFDDDVVPFAQSALFFESLPESTTKTSVYLKGGHNWKFWNEVNNDFVMQFLLE